MDHVVATFSNLWEVKFPGTEQPDISCIKSKQLLEEEIKRHRESLEKLKLDLQKEEFLILYLNNLKEEQGLFDTITDVDANSNNVNIQGNIDVSNADSDSDDDYDMVTPDMLPPSVVSMQATNVNKTKSNTMPKKAMSLDKDIYSPTTDTGKHTRSYTFHEGSTKNKNSSSSSDDEHEYMNAFEFSKPLPPKPPLRKEPQVDVQTNRLKQSMDAMIYENNHMKPKFEKLNDSESNQVEEEIYSVPKSIKKKPPVKRLGSNDRKGTSFSDDLNVTGAMPLPANLETILNSSHESLVDELEDEKMPTIVVEGSNYEDDSHIYANIEDLVIHRKSDEDSSDNGDIDTYGGDTCPIPTHYREMTVDEVTLLQRQNESDDDLQLGYGYDDDRPFTPEFEKKVTAGTDQEHTVDERNDSLTTISKENKKNGRHPFEQEKVMATRNRKYLVMNLLDTEKCYNDCLDILSKFMKPLRVSTTSSQPILSPADFDAIFHRADELVAIHREFMCKLEPLVQDWTDSRLIGEPFKTIMFNFDLYSMYISNYKHAMDTVLKCRHANEQFASIMDQDIRIPSLKEPLKLDGLLYKPIDRMTQYSLLLNDLLKYTPSEHPDHLIIVEISGELFNLFEQVNVDTSKKKRRQRQFLKESAMVELVDGNRRARNLILFNDVIISSKLKDSYICKWYAALKDISLSPYRNSEENQPVPTSKSECDKLRASLGNLRQELRKEQPTVNVLPAADATSPFVKRHHSGRNVRSSSRAIDKLRKKIYEQDQLLQLITPIVPLCIYLITGKTYTLLLPTEADRNQWMEALKPRIKKANVRIDGPIQLSSLELQQAFETVLKVQRLASRRSVATNLDVTPDGRPKSLDLSLSEDYNKALFGYIFVNIHNAKGFNKTSDTYVVLETDSYGHYFKKAKTKQARGAEPQWDEQFELEVEACKFLRLTCFSKRLIGDEICGKVNIDLSRENLEDNKNHTINVSLDKGMVTMNISLCFATTSEGIRRSPSKSDQGVFGVPISVVCKREKSDIPAVVISCIKEVEKRGMDEVGIYRLSGIASEIQQLKKLFNEDTQMAVLVLTDVDVHAVAGLLKLYFRDLPQSLFTSKQYHKFVSGLSMSDPEDKELYMLDMLHELPRVNLLTALYLFDHLRRVVLEEKINKMGINNLATVFGPTVLRSPASGDKENERDSCNVGNFDIGALDVMSQVGIFRYLLSLNNERVKLPDDDIELWKRLDSEKAMKLEMGATQEFLI